MKKYKFILQNLDCANCANKIQNKISSINKYKNVIVNFSTLKLTFETSESENVKEEIANIIKKIEPEVEVLEINENNEVNKKSNIAIIRLCIGVILALIGSYINLPWNLNFIVIIMAYLILLYRTSRKTIKLIVKSKLIDENFLITISSIGAYLVGKHIEGLMVIILYEIGKILEEKAINNSRKSVRDLMNIKPQYANLKIREGYKQVKPENVKIGDILIIKQGEKIPLDGIIIKGESKLDTSALTGESALLNVKQGDKVISGSINIDKLIEIKVTVEYENSTVSKILELVENATDKKARTETFVSKAAKIYTPVVVLLAIFVVIFLPIIFKNITFSQSIYKALILLVISCPCSIAISVPLSYFSGIGRASKEGILIKGSDYLDNLKNIKEIIFDKTGTLTTGTFNVSEVNSFYKEYKEKDILNYAALGESFSNHPIAKSILNCLNVNKLDTSKIKEYSEIPGNGIKYILDGAEIKIGNKEFCEFEENLEIENTTIIYISKDKKVIGSIVIKDKIKENVKDVIERLNREKIVTRMFTGDNKNVALKIANETGIKNIKYEMLPTDKYNELEKILEKYKNTNYKVAFVGDGINDSPVLALSDIGISMGEVGSESAIEASDVVIMKDNIGKIFEAIKISRKTGRIINQNLIFAIGTKFIILLFSIIGIAGMWQAVFADVGVTLITILNTLRILKMK